MIRIDDAVKSDAHQRGQTISETIFLVEEAAEGGFTASALNVSVFTQADTLDALCKAVRDAVRCHFD